MKAPPPPADPGTRRRRRRRPQPFPPAFSARPDRAYGAAAGLGLCGLILAAASGPLRAEANGAPAAATGSAAGKIALRVAPDTVAAVMVEVEREDPSLAAARPVADATKRVEGWSTVDYNGTFKGFIERVRITEDFRVAPGSPVHHRPDASSPLLTTLEAGDRAEVILAGDWLQVRFEKPVPLFFLHPLPVPVVTPPPQPPAAVLEPAAPPEPGPPPPAPAPAVILAPPPVAVPANPSPPADRVTPVPPGPPSPPTTPSGLPRYFEGVLQPTGNFLGIKAPYRLKLVDRSGKRLCYVDTASLVAGDTLDRYFGRAVLIYGEPGTPAKKGRGTVVRARTIRLK